jgi:2-methylcitrate dehydratase PrpD
VSSNKPQEDPIVPLVRHVHQTRFADLPRAVVDKTKLAILDSIAVTLAGSSAPGVLPLLSELREWGGRPQSRVAVFGGKLAAHDAALANATMAHALEIDDAHYPAIVHPTTPTLWPALALADARGGLSGAELLTAVALGVDVMARIALAAPRTLDLGYHSELYAVFGAAATSGKILDLDEQQLQDAFGIAFPQAAASVQAGIDGALVKRLQLGLNAANGMKAASLARRGISGVSKVLDGSYGVYRLFNHSGCDAQTLLDGLGDRFLGAELSMKLYPSSRCSHAAIEGTLELVALHDLRPQDVARVRVEVQEGCFKREQRPYDPRPGSAQVAAQFSIDYNVAAAILWREVFVAQTLDQATLDPQAIDLARRVSIHRNTTEPGNSPYLPVNICIELKDGTELRTTVRELRGSPSRPLGWSEVLSERLERCVPFAARPLSDGAVEGIESFVRRLEEQPDVRPLLDWIASGEERP